MIGSTIITSPPVALDLPDPVHSQARLHRLPRPVTLNLTAGVDGTIDQIQVDRTSLGGVDQLKVWLDQLSRSDSKFTGQMILRADRHLRFDRVRPVLQSLAQAGIDVIYIAARQDSEMERPELP